MWASGEPLTDLLLDLGAGFTGSFVSENSLSCTLMSTLLYVHYVAIQRLKTLCLRLHKKR